MNAYTVMVVVTYHDGTTQEYICPGIDPVDMYLQVETHLLNHRIAAYSIVAARQHAMAGE